MKYRKQILKMFTIALCVGMLAGCGEKQENPAPTPTTAATTAPTKAAEPTAAPTEAAEPTATPKPTNTPKPTATPKPTNTPKPTATPAPTVTPVPEVAAGSLTGLTAYEIVSYMVVGWNLGNTLDSVGSNIGFDSAPAKSATAWGNIEPNKEIFEAVKAAGIHSDIFGSDHCPVSVVIKE